MAQLYDRNKEYNLQHLRKGFHMSNHHGFRPEKKGARKGFLWAGGISGGIGIGYILLVFVLPGFILATIGFIGFGVTGVLGEDNMPYEQGQIKHLKQSLERITPKESWTKTADSGVHKAAKCTDMDANPSADECERYRAVWDTNTTYSKEVIKEVIESFGQISPYEKIDKQVALCARTSPDAPLSCEQKTYITLPGSNSTGFKLQITDSGPGSKVLVTVTNSKRN